MFNSSNNLSTGNNGTLSGAAGGTMPNMDNREDWTNLKEIKGVSLICMPPYHFYNQNIKDNWKTYSYNKEFHYIYNGSLKPEKDISLIALALQNNNKHSYIERALYHNQAEKHTLSIGMFVSDNITDYPKYELKLIDEISEVLHGNNLRTKDLWREFDFNRAPSPFMYLDREQWKLLLIEIDKLVEWRYSKYGEPELPEKDPTLTGEDYSDLKDDIGKRAATKRTCLLRTNPSMTSNILKDMSMREPLTIVDYDNNGYYKVQLSATPITGWVIASSVTTDMSVLPEEPKDIPKPDIIPTMTQEEYLGWKELTDPKLIDIYASECEVYDKNLKEIINAAIVNDDRLTALTTQEKTLHDNNVYYSTVEGTTGDSGHCVKPAAELNSLYKPGTIKVEPIYPDLTIPPNYSPAENNINIDNPIPPTLLNTSGITGEEDFNEKQFGFDFELIKDKKKESKGHPVNYLDAYPYDDKIIELEKHHPKIKIDALEARMYESNHPGDHMPQAVAKNFAMIYDSMLKQAANTEKRLVRIENVLAQTLRSVGRVGARVNINCVYYGGQDTFGKYKSIRCLKDDRIHDACSVTLDQCLSCTRYEPILGQVYDILDETGLNGSIYLDNIQMAYSSVDEMIGLNKVENRNLSYPFANAEADIEKPISQIEEWEKQDKEAYISKLKESITSEEELKDAIENMKQEDYTFRMNWYEQDLELQKPDVKQYPLEGIISRYKRNDLGNESAESENEQLAINDEVINEVEDDDYLKDLNDLEKLNKGEWVDTREEATTFEINEYSTEDYYFKGFNEIVGGTSGSVGGVFGAEARKKIVDKALEIVQLHADGKAGYSQATRTIDDTDRKIGSNAYLKDVAMYDCSSFTSACYKHAGLTNIFNKNTNGAVSDIVNNGGEMWLANEEGLKKAMPGDLIYTTVGKVNVDESDMGRYITTQHVVIYIGDRKVAHASTGNAPVPNQIKISDIDYYLDTFHFFAKPKDLIEADKKAASNSITSGGHAVIGTINTTKGENFDTIYSFPRSVCSAYIDIGTGAGGVHVNPNEGSIVAAHNMPYGTIVYIKEMDGKAGGGTVKTSSGKVLKELGSIGNGVFYVGDTGGPYFDFDISTIAFSGKANMDVMVLEWGKDTRPFWSFTDAMNFYDKRGEWPKFPEAVLSYRQMNGTTIGFHKFKDTDKNINSNPKWLLI